LGAGRGRQIREGLRPFVKLDELLALCLVLGVSPVDLLVPADLDDHQPYAVTPKITAVARDARNWFRGEAFLLRAPKGKATGLYEPKLPPTAADIAAFIQWMPDDAGRTLT
jgi:hypothetical protein